MILCTLLFNKSYLWDFIFLLQNIFSFLAFFFKCILYQLFLLTVYYFKNTVMTFKTRIIIYFAYFEIKVPECLNE